MWNRYQYHVVGFGLIFLISVMIVLSSTVSVPNSEHERYVRAVREMEAPRVTEPRLVGYGCEGAAGPLFAAEEDHLPECAAILVYGE